MSVLLMECVPLKTSAVLTVKASTCSTRCNSVKPYESIIKNETETAEIISNEDLLVIERICASEARGESFEGIAAVAQTIKDRADLWGLSYIEAATAEGQYAAPYKGEINENVESATKAVFLQGYRVFEKPTTHFHNSKETPYWATGKEYRGQIDNHKFYY